MRPVRPILITAACIGLAAAVSGCASNASPSWTFAPATTGTSSSGAAVPALAARAAAPALGNGAAAGASGTAATSGNANAMPQMAAMTGTMAKTAGSFGTGLSSAQAPASATSVDATTRLDLTIVTGDMINHTEFPAYVPSDFTLPANSTVVVTITNFDDATPLPANALIYASATGIVGGTFTETPIKAASPNRAAGATRTLTALKPADVSHTFTIPALGINVPLAAFARTTFTIHTGAPGTYAWRCMDPCGTGPTGWGTAMAAKQGFMEGTLTVA